MGGQGSGSQGNATTISDLLPPGVSAFFIEYLNGMKGLMTSGVVFNPVSEPFFTHPGEATYAPQNADELEGIDRIVKRSNGLAYVGAPGDYIIGKTIATKGETEIRNNLDGLKFNINPKADMLWTRRKEEVLQEWTEEILPRVNSVANLNGVFGSSGHHIMQAKEAEKVMKRLIAISAEIYGQDYHAERDLQAIALELGVSYAKQEINDADMLRQAGLYKREYEQGRLEDLYRAHKRESDRMIKLLEILGNAVRTGMGAQVSKTQPMYQPSTISQVAGIALAGAGMASMIYSGAGGAAKTPSMTPQGQGTPMAGAPTPMYSAGSEVPTYQLEGF